MTTLIHSDVVVVKVVVVVVEKSIGTLIIKSTSFLKGIKYIIQ